MSQRRQPDAVTWPRARRVADYGALLEEMRGATFNGLRNIYRLDIRGLEGAYREQCAAR
ncbi:MAG TPA: hypothetical protein VHG93_12540 [Longimicrobium sp.]|nr:hypothetical protein [Longimicrobium sp.]